MYIASHQDYDLQESSGAEHWPGPPAVWEGGWWWSSSGAPTAASSSSSFYICDGKTGYIMELMLQTLDRTLG